MDFRIFVTVASLFTSAHCMDNIVRLSPYDSKWELAYQVEAQQLRSVLHPAYAKTIDHVGSTSVKGMWAKPVIDILIGTDGDDILESDIRMLESIGYEFVERSSYCDRYYFKKSGPELSYNLSITTYKGETWKKMIYFRNYIREVPEAKEKYLAVKLEAIMSGFNTLPEYSAFKRGTIAELEKEAFLYAQQSL